MIAEEPKKPVVSDFNSYAFITNIVDLKSESLYRMFALNIYPSTVTFFRAYSVLFEVHLCM